MRIGMVFQKPNPFPKSIFENVAYGLRVRGVRESRDLGEEVEKALRGAAIWDEVKDRLDDSALALSGGQMQRLCIARALATEPGDPAVRRADLGARSDRDGEDRGADRRAARPGHGADRHAQHAAGRARVGLHGLHVPRRTDRVRRDEQDLHEPDARRRPRTTSPAVTADGSHAGRRAVETASDDGLPGRRLQAVSSGGGDPVEGHTSKRSTRRCRTALHAVDMGGLVIDQVGAAVQCTARSATRTWPNWCCRASRRSTSYDAGSIDEQSHVSSPCSSRSPATCVWHGRCRASASSSSGSATNRRRSRVSRCSVATRQPRRPGGRGRALPAAHGRALDGHAAQRRARARRERRALAREVRRARQGTRPGVRDRAAPADDATRWRTSQFLKRHHRHDVRAEGPRAHRRPREERRRAGALHDGRREARQAEGRLGIVRQPQQFVDPDLGPGLRVDALHDDGAVERVLPVGRRQADPGTTTAPAGTRP